MSKSQYQVWSLQGAQEMMAYLQDALIAQLDHSHVVQLFQRHAFLSWWILFWPNKSEFHLGTKDL
jgi:hypothetical protein